MHRDDYCREEGYQETTKLQRILLGKTACMTQILSLLVVSASFGKSIFGAMLERCGERGGAVIRRFTAVKPFRFC